MFFSNRTELIVSTGDSKQLPPDITLFFFHFEINCYTQTWAKPLSILFIKILFEQIYMHHIKNGETEEKVNKDSDHSTAILVIRNGKGSKERGNEEIAIDDKIRWENEENVKWYKKDWQIKGLDAEDRHWKVTVGKSKNSWDLEADLELQRRWESKL